MVKGSGAYLIVLPMTAGAGNPLADGDTGGPNIAAGEITQVRYDGGHVCSIPRASLMGSCPPVGFVPLAADRSQRRPARQPDQRPDGGGEDLLRPANRRRDRPLRRPPPAGFQHMQGQNPPSLLAQVSFVSHVAIRNSASYYNAEFGSRAVPPAQSEERAGPTDYDIRAGQRVRFDMLIPDSCPGRVHGTIAYIPTSGAANSMPIIGLPGQGHSILVGRFSFRVP